MIAENHKEDRLHSTAVLVYGNGLVMTIPAGIREQGYSWGSDPNTDTILPPVKGEQTDKRKKGG